MLKKFEQHLQTVVSTVAIALLLWVGVSVNALQQSATTGHVDRKHLKEDVNELKQSVKAAYSLTRAIDLEHRVRDLEINRGISPTSMRVPPGGMRSSTVHL